MVIGAISKDEGECSLKRFYRDSAGVAKGQKAPAKVYNAQAQWASAETPGEGVFNLLKSMGVFAPYAVSHQRRQMAR